MRNPRVLMLLQSDFPPDIRVEKEALTLQKALGAEVFVLANNKTGRPRREPYRGITVLRLPAWKVFGSRIARLMNYPLWFNPVWLLQGFVACHRVRPDVIHVHDLPLMFLGLILARLFRARLVYDLHENYPATFDLWKKGGIFRPIVRNKRLAVWYDKFSLKKADAIIVVEPEHRQWIYNHYQIRREIHVVPNTVELSTYSHFPPEPEISKRHEGKKVIAYVGQISPERDLDVAIHAMKEIRRGIPAVKLLIVGDGPDLSRLRRLVEELKLQDFVEFTGWVSFQKTAAYIHLSDVCIIPQGSNDLIDNGTPHKLYQYMALGKPVVVSDARAMKRIVSGSGAGEIFRSRDPQSLAGAIQRVLNSPGSYGKKGMQAVRERYNWEKTSRALIDCYRRLLGMPDS